MQETFAIIWAAKNRDGAGVGTKRFSQTGAEAVAAELNQSYPDFIHAAVDTATQDLAQAVAALRQNTNFSSPITAAPPAEGAASSFDNVAEATEATSESSETFTTPAETENESSVVAA